MFKSIESFKSAFPYFLGCRPNYTSKAVSSLYSRREKLSLQYAIRLAANPSNPAHEVTFPPNYVNLYEQKPKAIKSFGIRISPLLESANIKPQNIDFAQVRNNCFHVNNMKELFQDIHIDSIMTF